MIVKICAVCGEPEQAYQHTAEGWVSRRCLLKASTVMATYIYEDGRKFHVHLKTETPAKSLASVVQIKKGALAQ